MSGSWNIFFFIVPWFLFFYFKYKYKPEITSNREYIERWIKEKNIQKKRKKFVDYLLYRGYESFLVFDKLNELEKEK